MTFGGQHDTHINTGEEYPTITLKQLFSFDPTHNQKSRGWAIIPSSYHEYDGRKHERQRENGSFVALCGDIDKGDHAIEDVEEAVRSFVGDASWLIYASAHCRPGNRRWRIVVPLAEETDFEFWHDAQLAFFEHMEGRGLPMDGALARAGQPVYLPNVPTKHEASGVTLRADDGSPLYFERKSHVSDSGGLALDHSTLASGIHRIREKRRVDEEERARIREEGLSRRKRRPITQGDDGSLIEAFNRDNSVEAMLDRYGYQQDPRSPVDWRSRYQQGETYATRAIENGKWISLSTSDADVGVGERCQAGCFGDAYDLFAHYEHGGDHKSAFRALAEERRSTEYWRDEAAPDPDPIAEQASEPTHASEAEIVQPVDLWARYDAPALPKGLLPDEIEEIAFRQGEVMGVDPAGMAMAMLAVCAASITDEICVQVKAYEAGWRESARLWIGMIGPPSRKKSPIMRFAMRPLARTDSVLMRAYMQKKDEYDLLTPTEKKKAQKPVMKRHVVSDATIETLQEILQSSTGGIISEQDELSGWFGGMDKYANGKGQVDRAFYLKAYNGGRYTVDRVSRGSKLIPNLSMSLIGGIQPDPLRKIMGETVDDGLVQRLLPVILAPAGTGKDIPNRDVEEQYSRLIERLLAMKPETKTLSQYESERAIPMKFAPEAKVIRERLAEEHLDLERALEFNSPKLASHFGKYDGIFARLCVVWHCIEHSSGLHPAREISGATAQKVADFMEQFIRPSAIAFYVGMLRYSDGHDELQTIASFIVANKLEMVVPRDVSKASPTLKSYDADDIRRLFERLENFGWLEQAPPKPKSNKPCWIVNPAVHALYAERGQQEAERRERARKALLSTLK